MNSVVLSLTGVDKGPVEVLFESAFKRVSIFPRLNHVLHLVSYTHSTIEAVMHDHDHSHPDADGFDHDFGAITEREETLYRRQQVLHIAVEIYKSGVPRDTGGTPHFTVEQAMSTARELMQAADDYIVGCRIEKAD